MKWSRATALLLLTVLTLPLIACALGDAVQRFAEPIDRAACITIIKRMPDVKFNKYVYETDACYGRTSDGDEILVYQTIQ